MLLFLALNVAKYSYMLASCMLIVAKNSFITVGARIPKVFQAYKLRSTADHSTSIHSLLCFY